MKKKLHKKINTKTGISLVISLIMMTLLLSVSFSIANIILRQLRLTNTGTNSQTSFYAADSILECALYWDTLTDGTVAGDFSTAIFGTTTPTIYINNTNPIKCGNNPSNPLSYIKVVDAVNGIATTTFDIDYGQKVCGRVQIVKTEYRTIISTSGYNTGATADGSQCDLSQAVVNRTVERGLIFAH